MRNLVLGLTLLALSLSTTGCKPPKITFTIGITPQGGATATQQKTLPDVAASDVAGNSQQVVNALIDTEPVLTYDSTSPAQAVVTVTTDNGRTFAQTFAVTQADASSFAPAAAGTQTHAFAAQDPSAVSSFLQSAASNATATLTIDVQTRATFQGPTDGNQHTIYSRQYTPASGVLNLGSATYVAPGSPDGGGGSDVTSIDPNHN